jgi:RNA polymerase sigma-70 factor (ECF subfamily)
VVSASAPSSLAGMPRVSPRTPRPVAGRALDRESRRWLQELGAPGAQRDAAVARLHALLVRAARFEISRRRATLSHVRDDPEDLALECADDALLAILGKLDSFRGASRFTTWAYKFALLEAAVKLRRAAWQSREIPLSDDGWAALAAGGAGPDQAVGDAVLLAAIADAIRTRLTPHQRDVLIALALNDVPIDVLAERLSTTRGALYKTLHDARRRLRGELAHAGFALDISQEDP